jgi:hypothetical protein
MFTSKFVFPSRREYIVFFFLILYKLINMKFDYKKMEI